MILNLFEIVVIVLILGFVVTQIAKPLWCNTPLFPMFRNGREKKLEAYLKNANQEIENLKLQLELKSAEKQADALRKKAEPQVKKQ